ncbi:MAG: pilus assembly protein [Hyphomicrobiales bacterium]|nr:pilus assembly protein [Hyphomicrobiales bacterium]
MSSLHRGPSLKRSLLARLRGTAGDERGLSAVEFALIVPIMISLYLGAVEFGHALTIDRRVTSVASATADLVAQVETMDSSAVTDVFEAATAILTPYATSPLSIVVTSVVADEDNKTTVAWSCARNGTAHPDDSSYTLPAGLTQPFSSVIVAEVSYVYDPPVGQYLTGGITMGETFYLRPRRSLEVDLTSNCP